MSMDLDALLSGQRDIYGRISRTVDNLKKLGSANVTRSHVETRINILDQLWAKFENQHELIRTSYKDKFNDCEYAKTNFVDTTENMYVQQRSTLAEYLNTFRTAPEESLINQTTDRAPKTSLPRIKLQQFSGAYEEWPTFRDLFLSVIEENQSISNIERFHYLRSCLQGPAEKLIRSLTVTGENYDRAWAILSKQYENKRELIRSNFSTFTAVTKMKGESAEELSRVLNAVTTAVNAQESIGRPIKSHGMDLLNHFVVELFDSRTRLEWESSLSDSTDPPEHEALVNFITKRILTLNAAKPKSSKHAAKDSSQSARTHLAKRGPESSRCPLCKEQHSVMLCNDFKSKTAAERRSVETHRLCFNCLGNHLVAKCQSKKNCFTCNARHHTMLHEAAAASGNSEASSLSAARQNQGHKAVLLATARVNIADRYGNPHIARALIDQGSEVSLISEALAQSLHLSRTRSAVTIFGVGEAYSGSTRGKVRLNLTSLVTGATLSAVAFVLPRLSLYKGAATKCKTSWPHIQGLPLADPEYWAGDRIELLLGAEVCSTILEDGVRKGTPHTPLAQKTTLGWILSGGCGGMAPRGPLSSLLCSADSELNELVQHFWEQEREQPISVPLTPQEEECENFFVRTHGRTATGRYVVRLPFSATPTTLAETRQPALRVLSSMERKFERDPQFGKLYCTSMQEYEDLQHMEVIPASNATKPQVCYLPHHGVLRETSTTTKLRVVFNGSQRARSGQSLNSHLLVGANLLPALADVLLRWRWHRYALVADIEKMYRQILVHPDDRDYQRILWRPADEKEVREYRLNTVTYGLACAPFLAIRSVRQLAVDEGLRFPRGAAVLRRDCYVDDVVTGADTLSDAVAVQTELRNLCMAGGFPLRKWAANNSEILTGIPPDHRLSKPSCEWRHESYSTLGLRWHPLEDSFAFVIQPRTITEYTKRRVLAETARLFDPLGWLAPVVIRAKIWIQSAWLRQLEWDEPLPEGDHHNWKRFLSELPVLERVRVKRWLGSNASSAQAELHGFADASERGYAAVIYLRVSHDDTVSSHLIKAKSKVAPVKQVSLPRLELCAAKLLADLAYQVRSSLNLSTAPVHLWSDSKVTLQWIHGHASRWKTYVANRVSLIQTQLPDAQWHHVPGQDNPADCASRGITPEDLINHPLWWTGPRWLSESSAHCPKEKYELPEAHVLEQRHYTLTATNNIDAEPESLLRFSTLHRLLRVTAWCLRWRRVVARTRTRGPPEDTLLLDPLELDEALFRWLSALQTLHYADEVAALRKGLTVPRRSTLTKLSPFLDENGVMRVGGRLKHALLAYDEKYPMIVPPSSWITRLIIEAHHRRTLHGGVQLTLGSLRLRF